MLKVYKDISEKSPLGIRVSIIAGELRECESLRVFETNFKKRLESLKTGNNTKADTVYRCKFVNEWMANEKLLIVKQSVSSKTQKSVDKIIFTITK